MEENTDDKSSVFLVHKTPDQAASEEGDRQQQESTRPPRQKKSQRRSYKNLSENTHDLQIPGHTHPLRQRLIHTEENLFPLHSTARIWNSDLNQPGPSGKWGGKTARHFVS